MTAITDNALRAAKPVDLRKLSAPEAEYVEPTPTILACSDAKPFLQLIDPQTGDTFAVQSRLDNFGFPSRHAFLRQGYAVLALTNRVATLALDGPTDVRLYTGGFAIPIPSIHASFYWAQSITPHPRGSWVLLDRYGDAHDVIDNTSDRLLAQIDDGFIVAYRRQPEIRRQGKTIVLHSAYDVIQGRTDQVIGICPDGIRTYEPNGNVVSHIPLELPRRLRPVGMSPDGRFIALDKAPTSTSRDTASTHRDDAASTPPAPTCFIVADVASGETRSIDGNFQGVSSRPVFFGTNGWIVADGGTKPRLFTFTWSRPVLHELPCDFSRPLTPLLDVTGVADHIFTARR